MFLISDHTSGTLLGRAWFWSDRVGHDDRFSVGILHEIQVHLRRFPFESTSLFGSDAQVFKRDLIGANVSISFIKTGDDGFAAGSTTTFAAHMADSKVRLIDLDFEGRKRRTAFPFFSNAASDFRINLFDAFVCQRINLSSCVSGQIKRKILDNSPCFPSANFGIPIVSV